jgi:RNA polymerase sigma factor (sigma-70 family)
MDSLEKALASRLTALRDGDDSAREKILEICDSRLRALSHRLLGKFATVRRWDNTDDVAQQAAMRLYRALGQVVPEDPRGLMALMATTIQRELLDLARKHAGPMSYAANHGTNILDGGDGSNGSAFVVDEAEDRSEIDEEIPLDRWEHFHAAVEALPEENREVFKLVWYLGLDRQSVANALGISLRTAGRRWREAMGSITRALDKSQREPDQ